MTELSLSDFGEFYAQVHVEMGNGTRKIYPWQESLLSSVTNGPDAYSKLTTVIAPTGAGKSILGTLHLFLGAVDPTTPPRMFIATPRRALVDQMNDELTAIVKCIDTSSHPLLVEVRERLLSRRIPRELDPSMSVGSCAVVDTFRGGVYGKRASEWADDPNTVSVITATPHMVISTLLSRSYGYAPKRHAPYAGLLGVGTVLVFDEAHLQRQAVKTARCVAEMVREDCSFGSVTAHGLSVIEMTATLCEDMNTASAVTISDADTSDDSSQIAKVLTAPKTVVVTRLGDVDKVEDVLKDNAIRMVTAAKESGESGRTVAVVANSVKVALAVTKKLRKSNLTVMPLTGRVRMADRDALLRAYHGVLTKDGNPDVDVVVSTQVIEVGVDADFYGMVTELASGDALAQRFGRVNRHGRRDSASEIVVVKPSDVSKVKGVYSEGDLRAAEEWLESLVDGSASPLSIRRTKTPVREPDRAVVERFHRGDALRMFLNSGQPPAVYDFPEFWLTDSLSTTPETRIVVRRGKGGMSASTREDLLKALPPQDLECWNLDSFVAESVLKRLWSVYLDPRKSRDTKREGSVLAIDVRRDSGEVVEYEETMGEDGKPVFPRVGWTTVVIWSESHVPMLEGGAEINGITVSGVPDTGGKGKAVPVATERLLNGRGGDSVPTTVYLTGEVPIPTDDDKTAAASWGEHPDAPYWSAARRAAANGEDKGGFVLLGARGDDDVPLWTVVVPYTINDPDNPGSGDTNSSISESSSPVLLKDHRQNVSELCEKVARMCGVEGDYVEGVRLSGLYHDDGKSHPLFQAVLKSSYRKDEIPVEDIAKSPQNAPSGTRKKTDVGLPRGWRHEQLSAAIAAHELRENTDRALVSVLAGLTHGYGRLMFPHGWESLIAGIDANGIGADDIFTDGTWEQWVTELSRDLGPWHISWLEALVRAADHLVSAQKH